MPFLVPTAATTPPDDTLAGRGLPESCFVRSPGDYVWRIVRGRLGLEPCPALAWTDAADGNARAGVRDAQRRAMLMGATYGWDVPAADPATYAEGSAWRVAWIGGAPCLEVPPPTHPDHVRLAGEAMALVGHRLPFGTLERSRDAYERLRIAEEGWLAAVAREIGDARSRTAA
jgi:hypothetical protein